MGDPKNIEEKFFEEADQTAAVGKAGVMQAKKQQTFSELSSHIVTMMTTEHYNKCSLTSSFQLMMRADSHYSMWG